MTWTEIFSVILDKVRDAMMRIMTWIWDYVAYIHKSFPE